MIEYLQHIRDEARYLESVTVGLDVARNKGPQLRAEMDRIIALESSSSQRGTKE